MFRLALLIALAIVPTAALAATPSPQDDAAIRAVVRGYLESRDRGDAAALGALITADADQHLTSGEWRRGHDKMVAGTIGATPAVPGSLKIGVDTVRLITPDTAVVDGPYDVIGPGGVVHNWTTIILVREGKAWRISGIRNALPTGK